MKVAIPSWQGRVSPVLDVACNLLLIDVENGQEVKRVKRKLAYADPFARAQHISQYGADMLICGAISEPLEITLQSAGVRVLANICGPIEDVLNALLNDSLLNSVFLMPGCDDRR